MPRPRRRCRVRGKPSSDYFKPAGVPLRLLKSSELTIPEFEAVRLNDCNRIEQEEAAIEMQISQPTFSRILTSARRKISDALVNGKAIKINKY